jgi:REP-associated tyrosine transposase
VPALHAHLVFVTKYRRPVFTDAMLTFTENTMRGVCALLDAELVEFNGEADHVHLLVAYPQLWRSPSWCSASKAAQLARYGASSPGACVRARMRGHLWSPSYFAVSCGGAPLSIIKQYIDGHARPL